MVKYFIGLIIVIVSGSFSTVKAQLSAEEKKIVAHIRKNMPQTLELLEEIVNINSGTLNTEGVREVGEVLRKHFDDAGFTTEWVNLPDSLKRAGHLVAKRKGTKGKKLFLIGHLDTVFEPDMPANPFRKLNEITATGQGVNDMKGGDLVILAALQALQANHLIDDASITAYFTGDEENAGRPITVSRGDFIDRAKKADIALGFEGAQALNDIATARRGVSGWQLKVKGNQAHSAGVFNGNYGAIYEASRIINQFRVELSNEKYLTFNPGLFVGGSEMNYDSASIQAHVSGKTNIISPITIVQGDLRFLSETQKNRTRAKMKKIVATGNLPGTSASIQFGEGIPAMEPTAGNTKLVELLSKVTLDMGIGKTIAGDPNKRGAGDISYIAKYVDCLDGMGASGHGAHAPGEVINLKELPVIIERAALLIYRLTR